MDSSKEKEKEICDLCGLYYKNGCSFFSHNRVKECNKQKYPENFSEEEKEFIKNSKPQERHDTFEGFNHANMNIKYDR